MSEDNSSTKINNEGKKSISNNEKKLNGWKCFISNGNNSQLIERILKSLGYEREEEHPNLCKFQWFQTIQQINWNAFKDGDQIVNHIQGEDYFTTKIQLYQSLKTYEKICLTMPTRRSSFLFLNEYIPQTFKIDEKFDRDLLFNIHQRSLVLIAMIVFEQCFDLAGDIWICKPSELNQGKGITLIRDVEELKEEYSQSTSNQTMKKNIAKTQSMKRIIQRYIQNPLLIEGKKFDIRCYMLIANLKPLLIFYHSGYLRLSMFDFDEHDENLLIHLTNQYVQKKDENYSKVKEETVWTMEQFNDYLNKQVEKNRRKDLPKNWVFDVLPKIVERILLNVIESIRMRLKSRLGCFGLYGFDLMIDDQMKVWLIEINVNPSLTTNTKILNQVIPPILQEAIHLSLECFDKIRHNQKIFPLKSLNGFQCIYNDCERKGSLAYVEERRVRSSSPTHRFSSSSSNLPNLQRISTKKSLSNLPKTLSILPDREMNSEKKSIVTYSVDQQMSTDHFHLSSHSSSFNRISIKSFPKSPINAELLRPTKTFLHHSNQFNSDSNSKSSRNVIRPKILKQRRKGRKLIKEQQKDLIRPNPSIEEEENEEEEEKMRLDQSMLRRERKVNGEMSVSNGRPLPRSYSASTIKQFQFDQLNSREYLRKSSTFSENLRSTLQRNLVKLTSNPNESIHSNLFQ